MEVDGPNHFTCNKPFSLLGSSLAKHTCLQARRWVVLSVPFYEWNAITAQVLGGSCPTPAPHTALHQPAASMLQQQEDGGGGAGSRTQLIYGQQPDKQQDDSLGVPAREDSTSHAASRGPAGTGAIQGTPAAREMHQQQQDTREIVEAAVAAAEAVGVPAHLALQLAGARAAYLRDALDCAVKNVDYPRHLLPQEAA